VPDIPSGSANGLSIIWDGFGYALCGWISDAANAKPTTAWLQRPPWLTERSSQIDDLTGRDPSSGGATRVSIRCRDAPTDAANKPLALDTITTTQPPRRWRRRLLPPARALAVPHARSGAVGELEVPRHDVAERFVDRRQGVG
jgi:hypothetical protein